MTYLMHSRNWRDGRSAHLCAPAIQNPHRAQTSSNRTHGGPNLGARCDCNRAQPDKRKHARADGTPVSVQPKISADRHAPVAHPVAASGVRAFADVSQVIRVMQSDERAARRRDTCVARAIGARSANVCQHADAGAPAMRSAAAMAGGPDLLERSSTMIKSRCFAKTARANDAHGDMQGQRSIVSRNDSSEIRGPSIERRGSWRENASRVVGRFGVVRQRR